MEGTKNERVNELLENMDVLDTVIKQETPAISDEEYRRQRQEWQAYEFADIPVTYVGNEDPRIDELRKQLKEKGLTFLQSEELNYRQRLQKELKTAKRDKAKKKRQARRYNRARQR